MDPKLMEEVDRAGFAVPKPGFMASRAGLGPGHAAAALFAWQTMQVACHIRRSYPYLDLSEEGPFNEMACDLLREAVGDDAGAVSTTYLEFLENAYDAHGESALLSSSYWALIASEKVEGTELRQHMYDMVAWFAAALWALVAARAGTAYPGYIDREEIVWSQSVDPSDLDRVLVRGYLNDLPLQESRLIVPHLPVRADDWADIGAGDILTTLADDLSSLNFHESAPRVLHEVGNGAGSRIAKFTDVRHFTLPDPWPDLTIAPFAGRPEGFTTCLIWTRLGVILAGVSINFDGDSAHAWPDELPLHTDPSERARIALSLSLLMTAVLSDAVVGDEDGIEQLCELAMPVAAKG